MKRRWREYESDATLSSSPRRMRHLYRLKSVRVFFRIIQTPAELVVGYFPVSPCPCFCFEQTRNGYLIQFSVRTRMGPKEKEPGNHSQRESDSCNLHQHRMEYHPRKVRTSSFTCLCVPFACLSCELIPAQCSAYLREMGMGSENSRTPPAHCRHRNLRYKCSACCPIPFSSFYCSLCFPRSLTFFYPTLADAWQGEAFSAWSSCLMSSPEGWVINEYGKVYNNGRGVKVCSPLIGSSSMSDMYTCRLSSN